jgi:hypothetical protein
MNTQIFTVFNDNLNYLDESFGSSFISELLIDTPRLEDYSLNDICRDLVKPSKNEYEYINHFKDSSFTSELNETSSLFAEEGSQIDDAQYLKAPVEVKLEQRPSVVLSEVKNEVKEEIKGSGIEATLDFCLRSKECKNPKKNISNIRFKQTKSREQLRKLKQALEKYPLKFPKKKRIELGKEIGLSETQIYKWYYDNNPNIAKRRKDSDFDSDWESEQTCTKSKMSKYSD